MFSIQLYTVRIGIAIPIAQRRWYTQANIWKTLLYHQIGGRIGKMSTAPLGCIHLKTKPRSALTVRCALKLHASMHSCTSTCMASVKINQDSIFSLNFIRAIWWLVLSRCLPNYKANANHQIKILIAENGWTNKTKERLISLIQSESAIKMY